MKSIILYFFDEVIVYDGITCMGERYIYTETITPVKLIDMGFGC